MARAAGATTAIATLMLICFGTTTAQAKSIHTFKSDFNGGAGHEFSDPTAVAVNDASGDVYVVDAGNNRVEYFNSDGTKFEGEFNGRHVAATGTGTLSAATGTGDLSAATGTGDLSAASGLGTVTDGSKTVTGVMPSAGRNFSSTRNKQKQAALRQRAVWRTHREASR
jgi:DNA-binding beta-propeller fold protein YncE